MWAVLGPARALYGVVACVGLRLDPAFCSSEFGEMPRKNRPFPFRRSFQSLEKNVINSGSAIAASYTLVGSILLLGGIGYLVDRWRGTAPWFLLAGLLLGMIVGFYELAKTVNRR